MFLFFVQYQKWDIHIGLTQKVFIEKWIQLNASRRGHIFKIQKTEKKRDGCI